MFSRTGYLLGCCWGGGAVEALVMKSAFHQLLMTAMHAQPAIAHMHNHHLNKVRKFKSIFVKVTTAPLYTSIKPTLGGFSGLKFLSLLHGMYMIDWMSQGHTKLIQSFAHMCTCNELRMAAECQQTLRVFWSS